MMKLFKNIDDKLKEIGFTKVSDDEYGACYERYNKNISIHNALIYYIKNQVNTLFSHMIKI